MTRSVVLAVSAGLLMGCGGPIASAPPPESPERARAASGRAECEERWLHMPVIVEFASEGSELDEDALALLRFVYESVPSRARQVRVEGHGFCAPLADSMALSELRAAVVARALIELGLPPERVTTVAYGATLPRADECWDLPPDMRTRGAEFSMLVCPSEPARSR